MATNGRTPSAAARERATVIRRLGALQNAVAAVLGDDARLSPKSAAEHNRIRSRIFAELIRVRPLAQKHGLAIPPLVVQFAQMAPAASAEGEFETVPPVTDQEWQRLAQAYQILLGNLRAEPKQRLANAHMFMSRYHPVMSKLSARGEAMPEQYRRAFLSSDRAWRVVRAQQQARKGGGRGVQNESEWFGEPVQAKSTPPPPPRTSLSSSRLVGVARRAFDGWVQNPANQGYFVNTVRRVLQTGLPPGKMPPQVTKAFLDATDPFGKKERELFGMSEGEAELELALAAFPVR